MSNDGTKQGASRRYIMSAVEASLTRLRTDWIDLYQLHDSDPLTPIEETLRALDDLVRQGKVRYIGCSNFPAWQVVEARTDRAAASNSAASSPARTNTAWWCAASKRNCCRRRRNTSWACCRSSRWRAGCSPASTSAARRRPPIRASPRRPPCDRYITPRNEDIVEKLEAFAKARGHSMLELAFSWLASRPQVASVIAGATSVEQVEQNVKAVGWALSAERSGGDRRDYEVVLRPIPCRILPSRSDSRRSPGKHIGRTRSRDWPSRFGSAA